VRRVTVRGGSLSVSVTRLLCALSGEEEDEEESSGEQGLHHE
jgi:hypothetical protein